MERRQQIAFALLLVACIFMALLLTGCTDTMAEIDKQDQEAETPSLFVLIERAKTWCVVYHRETRVMYAVSNGSYTYGNFTLLVNADGTPMIWEG